MDSLPQRKHQVLQGLGDEHKLSWGESMGPRYGVKLYLISSCLSHFPFPVLITSGQFCYEKVLWKSWSEGDKEFSCQVQWMKLSRGKISKGRSLALQIMVLGPSVVHRAKDHNSSGHQNKAVIVTITPPPGLLEEITWKGDSAWGSEAQDMCYCYKGNIVVLIGWWGLGKDGSHSFWYPVKTE